MSYANHSFTVTLDRVDSVTEQMAERIYSLIGDALLSSSNGQVRLDFDRKASSYSEAVSSAIRDIHNAGYEVASVTPSDDRGAT